MRPGHADDTFDNAAKYEIEYGKQTGIDPSLIMTIVEVESRDKAFKMGDDGLKAFNNAEWNLYKSEPWLLAVAGSPFKNGAPDLGITNISLPVWNILKKNYPSQFKGLSFTNLIGNDKLDIKATAYYLKYLQGQLKPLIAAQGALTGALGGSPRFSLNELTEAAYNTGLPVVEHNLSIGTMGPAARTYVSTVNTWEPYANAALCNVAGPHSRYCSQAAGQ